MRIVAPLLSSISLPQLSHTSTVLRAILLLLIRGRDERSARKGRRKAPANLRCFARAANSPRAKQADECLFLTIEAEIARADHPQVAWTEVLDRAPVQVLLDDGRADVRRPRDGRRVPEPLADRPHDRRDDPLRLRLCLDGAALRERDRSDERPAPGAEVLGCELFAHEFRDVLVEPPRVQAVRVAVLLVAKEPAAAPLPDQDLHRLRELAVDDRGPNPDSMLAAEAERDPAPAHRHVRLPQRRDPERLVLLRVPPLAHPAPREVG